jgi:hypothetical protein
MRFGDRFDIFGMPRISSMLSKHAPFAEVFQRADFGKRFENVCC